MSSYPTSERLASFVLTLDGLALSVDDSILCDDAELGRSVSMTLNSTARKTTANGEGVTLADRAISLEGVWLEVDIENVAGETPRQQSSKGRTWMRCRI